MGEFPCPLERTAASALLLLSSSTTTSTSPSLSPKFDFEDAWIKDGGSNSNSNDSGKRMGSVALSDWHEGLAEAILRLLSEACLPEACLPEARIREVLGNNPSTSKALRMLLKLEKVKRTGKGGRRDPYIYTIAK